ncbi:MAG: 30S ribosomal protein S2 [Leptospirillia bacterium]
MSTVEIKELLQAGVHFGHQARRWNPKMGRYILAKKNGVHVVDLRKTKTCFDAAIDVVRQVAERGGKILFVGTKKQAQDIVSEEAIRCGQFYVNRRWLGGQLTNFKTIKGRIAKLKELDQASEDGTYDRYSKREALNMERERLKLEASLGGIKEMGYAPDVMFVIDPNRERIAVSEANQLNIPVIAITDTNCDPDLIDYPIPGNDDAIRAIRLFVSRMADVILAARDARAEAAAAAKKVADAEAKKAADAAAKKAAEVAAKKAAEVAAKKAAEAAAKPAAEKAEAKPAAEKAEAKPAAKKAEAKPAAKKAEAKPAAKKAAAKPAAKKAEAKPAAKKAEAKPAAKKAAAKPAAKKAEAKPTAKKAEAKPAAKKAAAKPAAKKAADK